ncbi:MAG TPA: hypothetical protein VH877_10995 [Polyangia bacterium]|nr:hypothetical protein [Polyangia bacterium]
MPNETFETIKARVDNDPVHRTVDVPKINIDLSFTGILQRLDELMDAAHASGQLAPTDHQQLKAATAQARTVLCKVDMNKLKATLRAQPGLRFGRRLTPT